MDEISAASFQIIAYAGTARSMFLNAVQEAKAGRMTEAQALMEQGNDVFIEGHDAHMALLTQAAGEEGLDVNLLLVHAEDQLMSAEEFKILAQEFIDLYARVVPATAPAVAPIESKPAAAPVAAVA